MRKILSPMFSLLTVVGGHFLNRRLDLGLLFFALLLLAGLATFSIMSLLLWALVPDLQAIGGPIMRRAVYGLTTAIAVLWLASSPVPRRMKRGLGGLSVRPA